MKLKLWLVFLLLMQVALAQQSFNGKVTDTDGTPVPGVSILIEGTEKGTFTDFDGNFTIEANSGDTLIFSAIGFTDQSVAAADSMSVVLQTDTTNLSEVVVVGYGSMKVKDLTSSIATIDSEEIQRTPNAQVMQALQGKVAGLQVISKGAPGEAPTIRVRGIGSYPGKGDSTPLYVVDGMFFNNIDFLNPSDIATVSILKDASAAAMPGCAIGAIQAATEFRVV